MTLKWYWTTDVKWSWRNQNVFRKEYFLIRVNPSFYQIKNMPGYNHSIFWHVMLLGNMNDKIAGSDRWNLTRQSVELEARFPDLRETYLTIQATWTCVAIRTGMKFAGCGVTTAVTILLTLLKNTTTKRVETLFGLCYVILQGEIKWESRLPNTPKWSFKPWLGSPYKTLNYHSTTGVWMGTSKLLVKKATR